MNDDIYELIYRIEERIGVLSDKGSGTITGELSILRNLFKATPFVEVDIPIVGNKFEVQHYPVVVGDSAIVNGSAVISMREADLKTTIEEWRGISFSGKEGTIEGAGQKYDGKHITLTYYYSPFTSKKIVIEDSFIKTIDSAQGENVIIIEDLATNCRFDVVVSWDNVVSYLQIDSETTLNNVIVDIATGTSYELFLENGTIKYNEVQ